MVAARLGVLQVPWTKYYLYSCNSYGTDNMSIICCFYVSVVQQTEGNPSRNITDLPCVDSLWRATETTGDAMECHIVGLRHPVALQTT